MPPRYWSCRKCAHRNERAWVKCRGTVLRGQYPVPCDGRRPPKHVPKHAIVMRDNGYQHFRDVNELIHGQGDNCGVCGAVPKDSRNMHRQHASPRACPVTWSCSLSQPYGKRPG